MMQLTRALTLEYTTNLYNSAAKHTHTHTHAHTHTHKIQFKNGQRPEQTFLQRRYTDGQQAHEKMLNITNYQKNTNQNYYEVPPHTGQNGRH